MRHKIAKQHTPHITVRTLIDEIGFLELIILQFLKYTDRRIMKKTNYAESYNESIGRKNTLKRSS